MTNMFMASIADCAQSYDCFCLVLGPFPSTRLLPSTGLNDKSDLLDYALQSGQGCLVAVAVSCSCSPLLIAHKHPVSEPPFAMAAEEVCSLLNDMTSHKLLLLSKICLAHAVSKLASP